LVAKDGDTVGAGSAFVPFWVSINVV